MDIKINNTFIDNAHGLDIFMPMYDLLEYIHNYSMTSGSLWNSYRDEGNHDENENDNANDRISNNKTITSKCFKRKEQGAPPNDNTTLNAEVIVPLKYLSKFQRFLDLQLINCEIELNFLWSKECITSGISITSTIPAKPDANLPAQ